MSNELRGEQYCSFSSGIIAAEFEASSRYGSLCCNVYCNTNGDSFLAPVLSTRPTVHGTRPSGNKTRQTSRKSPKMGLTWMTDPVPSATANTFPAASPFPSCSQAMTEESFRQPGGQTGGNVRLPQGSDATCPVREGLPRCRDPLPGS